LLLAVALRNAPLPLLLPLQAEVEAQVTPLQLPTKNASLLAGLPRNAPLPLSKPAWRLVVALRHARLPRPL